jgi:ABC-2 type transport system ATP-binding protein
LAYPDFKVCHAFRAASFCYPNWDAGLASSLLKDFGLRANKAIKHLSRGQRSALGITIGLAARAEVTLFDEPCAGLDAVARQIFYDRLLAEYAGMPRTVVLSTRLIDEAAALFENVVVIDRGRVEDRERARSLGLDLTPLSLQQLVVHTSGGSAGAGSLTGRTSA